MSQTAPTPSTASTAPAGPTPEPATPTLTGTQLAGREGLPLLVLGPSLGTSVATLWGEVAPALGVTHHVVGWDLPGHGHDRRSDGRPFTVADLARGVLDLVDRVAGPRTRFGYAGDSIGGAVGLQLGLDAPGRVDRVAALCTGARIGDPEMWAERADLVRRAGTAAVVEGAAQRWFGPGFLERSPGVAGRLLDELRHVDPTGYAHACEALGAFDLRDRLGEIDAPVLAVAGSDDVATPTAGMRTVADGVRHGRLVVLDGVAHLAPAEAPARVVELLARHLAGDDPGGPDDGSSRHDAGMRVRREVLGDAHVDRATDAITDVTRDFQRFITEYAWGGIWTRPGLDRRSRSIVTLTALVAGGHHDELAMHLRAARTNGLSVEEISEVLLQTAVYCSVPAANSAFRVAQQVLGEPHPDPTPDPEGEQ